MEWHFRQYSMGEPTRDPIYGEFFFSFPIDERIFCRCDIQGILVQAQIDLAAE